MGGAIAVHTASSNLIPSLVGIIVIDVVEGTHFCIVLKNKIYLPPANEVAKVMFSQVSVCPQGGSLSRGVSVRGEVSVQGGLCFRGVCPGGSLSGGLCHRDPPPHYSNVRVVRILWECILVSLEPHVYFDGSGNIFHFPMYVPPVGALTVAQFLSYDCLKQSATCVPFRMYVETTVRKFERSNGEGLSR